MKIARPRSCIVAFENEIRETLNANPMLADWFFTRRAFEFLKTFLVPVLGFEDYWARIEYQHRGSAHLHGLGWPNTRCTPLQNNNETYKRVS